VVPARALAPVLSLHGERRLVFGPEIGRGTQGAVYVARLEQVIATSSRGDEVMARNVAVKVIEPALCHDAETVHELRRAARRSALVSHANVVQVMDWFVATTQAANMAAEATPCIVQELVAGMSLASFTARCDAAQRRVPLDLALFIACEVAEGLAGARHATSIEGASLNIAHHALGPRQILLSWNGEVKVGDFGFRPSGGVTSGVRRTDRDVRSQILHMAPEVARGARGDGRSDVFSLGVILHEMLYGPRFPRDTSARELLDLVRAGEVHRPIASPLLPPAIGDVVARALDVDPRARQEHAGILAYDLRREALALGVADGRFFLRSALFDMSEGVSASE
jgi:serine/threonine-protein kinase